MAKPDQALNLALAHLRRPAWPKTPPDFGTTPIPPLVEATLLTADEAVRLGLVAADRMTCSLSVERFDRFIESPQPRTLIIHAVDAEPGVPLLAFWALRNTLAIATFAARAARELGCEILFALPADLPDGFRKSLSALKPARFVDFNYPGGHWKLLPRAARVGSSSLVVDVVAATDWAMAVNTGHSAPERPVALAGHQALDLRTVPRGTRLEEDVDHETRWFAGPRLSDRVAESLVGDGELTFYRETIGDRSSSVCIRCGACLQICPTRVDPVSLLSEHVHGPRERVLKHAGIDACIDCGLCTATCPASIELHHVIAGLKQFRPERGHG